jgi:hypothetical protein
MSYRQPFFRLVALTTIFLEFVVIASANAQCVKPIPSEHISESDQGKATLQGCSRNGSSIKCELLLALKDNGNASLACKGGGWPRGLGQGPLKASRIIDSQGNEYECAKLKVGLKESNGESISVSLPENVEIRVVFTFNKVSPVVKNLQILEMTIGLDAGNGKVTFPNIEILNGSNNCRS